MLGLVYLIPFFKVSKNTSENQVHEQHKPFTVTKNESSSVVRGLYVQKAKWVQKIRSLGKTSKIKDEEIWWKAAKGPKSSSEASIREF